MRPFLAALLSSALAASALGAREPEIRARGGTGEARQAIVLREPGRWFVERDGRRTEVPLPAGASVQRIADVGSGWLLAGTRTEPDGSGELLFVLGEADGRAQIVPPPTARRGAIREHPVPLTSGRAWIGAAWLEGDRPDRFEIRFASWNGAAFQAPVTLVPAGAGSQLALAGAQLNDGRSLLVWAGFDGHDDEIWWIVGDDRGWSAAARVARDNDVPDITPVLLATRDGALVAWSRFVDGEYRLATARFDGRTFRDARVVGPPGSLFPSFEPGIDGGFAILFRDARARGWALSEIDSDGILGRIARLPSSSRERPVVDARVGSVAWRFGSWTTTSSWE
jgi:hypothetical protein